MNSINFLYDQDQHLLDKFVAWALTYGRTIVMVTELIALSAFLYRFGLDMQISDLNDSIKQEQTIIANPAEKAFEARDRNLQDRLSIAATLTTQATSQIQNILTLIDQAKGDVTFQNITESANTIKILVDASNSSGINNFVENLRNNLTTTAISIDSLQTKGEGQQLEAAISITLPGGTANP